MIRLIALLLTLAAPAHAQTFQDAVQSNFRLATDLCMRVMYRLEPSKGAFEEAGFSWFSVEGTVNNYGVKGQTRFYADAPGQTVRVSTGSDPNQITGLCRAFSAHLDEQTAAALVEQTVRFRFPAARRDDTFGWFVDIAGRPPLIISVGGPMRSRFPEDNGTASVSMSFPG